MSIVVSRDLPASFPAHLTNTSVGKKVLMAVTGIVTFGFVTGHMLGNLQVYMGPDQINHYAEALHKLGPILWLIRSFLFVSFAVHVWYGIQLKLENWAARPESYKCQSTVQATLASRTMIWTGLVILVFVVYHLLHYTVRVTNPEYQALADTTGRFDVYSMVIMGFSNYLVSGFYLIGVALLSYHLSHAVASMVQTFGLHTPQWQKRLEAIAWFFTIFLFLGYAAVPVGVMAGWLTLPQGGM
jgi:succinate dehydrogenase / fumarate reductase, cytochrome b subunit